MSQASITLLGQAKSSYIKAQESKKNAIQYSYHIGAYDMAESLLSRLGSMWGIEEAERINYADAWKELKEFTNDFNKVKS